MRRTGFAELRLCMGHVPMYREMVKLSAPLIEILVLELGTKKLIERFSDPLWFQSYACAMGFEHNYTGATTVTLKAIKEAVSGRNIGIAVAGGKGPASRETPNEIERFSEEANMSHSKTATLKRASRLSSKTDSSLVQDSFSIYFHSMILDEKGNYAVINQGMNTRDMLVRRYHWLNSDSFVEEPHSGIESSPVSVAMNLTSRESRETRKTITDIVRDEPYESLQNKLLLLDRSRGQRKIADFLNAESVKRIPFYLEFPRSLNRKAIEIAKQAENFEDVLSAPGMGQSTMRGLAYISSLIYGSKLSWNDPQSYCFAYGTKAGRPWYVERESMRESAEILRNALHDAKLGRKEKTNALRRLSRIAESYSVS